MRDSDARARGIQDRPARPDSRTGGPSRIGLRHEIKCAREAGRELGLVIFDLDWLERINGRFGSEAGDESALQVQHRRWCESARPSDLIARLGGDEFAVIAPGVGEPETYLIAERARHDFSREADPLTGESMTVSCGVAIFPKHGETPNGLFRRADMALYAAKQLGRRPHGDLRRRGQRRGVGSDCRGRRSRRWPGNASLSLAEVVDIRHFGGRNHAHRVGRYAESIAREMGLDEPTVDRVRLAGNAPRPRKGRYRGLDPHPEAPAESRRAGRGAAPSAGRQPDRPQRGLRRDRRLDSGPSRAP